MPDIDHIVIRNFRSHGDLSGFLDLFFDVFGQDVREIGVLGILAHTHLLYCSDVSQVVGDDLAHLGKVPAVPKKKLKYLLFTKLSYY
jgi:hypothetical protein